MIDIKIALEHFGISSTVSLHAVQQVREYIEAEGDAKRINRAMDLMEKLFGIKTIELDPQPLGTDYDYLLTIAQGAVDMTIKAGGAVEDVDALIAAAKERARKFITNPHNSWMFAKPEKTEQIVETRTIGGVETQVAVKADGSIKKGGKEVLAVELYKKHVLNAEKPLNNQEFIAILVKELGMSKSGATTYAYNCKKKFNPESIVARKK